jgi:anti-sigma regulatory factor (Ser/Thr protein kinase)
MQEAQRPDAGRGTLRSAVARAPGTTNPTAPPVEQTGSPAPLRLRLLAVPTAASITRHRLRRWLSALCWTDDQADDMVLAASEAVSNCIEHAYPPGATGHLELHARVVEEPASSARRVELTIQDHGSWKPAADDHAHRRGLALMRGCTERLSISHSNYGTTVTLLSKAVIAPSATSRHTARRLAHQVNSRHPRAADQSSA